MNRGRSVSFRAVGCLRLASTTLSMRAFVRFAMADCPQTINPSPGILRHSRTHITSFPHARHTFRTARTHRTDSRLHGNDIRAVASDTRRLTLSRHSRTHAMPPAPTSQIPAYVGMTSERSRRIPEDSPYHATPAPASRHSRTHITSFPRRRESSGPASEVYSYANLCIDKSERNHFDSDT